MSRFKFKKNNRGFTILEVLIAAMILVIAGLGAVAVEKQGIQSASYNKHKFQATGLAQESINLVTQIFATSLKKDNMDLDGVFDIWQNLGGVTPSGTYCLYKDTSDALLKLTNTPRAAGSDCSAIPEEITLNGVTFRRSITVTTPQP